MPVLRGRVFASELRRRRNSMELVVAEVVPLGKDRTAEAAQQAAPASFHGLSRREGVADGLRWAGRRGQDTHDAAYSRPDSVDSMEARGVDY